MYYSLTNFYQNHRRYVKSRDDYQLLGASRSYSSLSTDCEPYRGIANGSLSGGGIPYAPCGAIANSLFNGQLHICITFCHFCHAAGAILQLFLVLLLACEAFVKHDCYLMLFIVDFL